MARDQKNTKVGILADDLPGPKNFCPHHKTVDNKRGSLKYAQPQNMVMNYGGDPNKSPASARFVAE